MSMNTSVICDININRDRERHQEFDSNGERSSLYIGKKDITSDNKFAFLQNETAEIRQPLMVYTSVLSGRTRRNKTRCVTSKTAKRTITIYIQSLLRYHDSRRDSNRLASAIDELSRSSLLVDVSLTLDLLVCFRSCKLCHVYESRARESEMFLKPSE